MKTNDKIKAVAEEFEEEFAPFIAECFHYDTGHSIAPLARKQKKWLQHRLETLVREELKEIHDEIPEAYGWGKEDEEADRGYRICSKNVKAMIRRRIADYQQ